MKSLPSLVVLATLACAATARAAVPSADITLQPVLTDNLPVFTSLTAYNYTDSDVVPTSTDPYDAPLYYPFDTTTAAWWDNLVADQLQARLPVVMFATRGVPGAAPGTTITATSPAVGNNMDPRLLSNEVSALSRAGATSLVKLACFVDNPSAEDLYVAYYGKPAGTTVDLSNADVYNQIYWLRMVKPWFDTVPSSSWYEINGRPVIQFWSLASKWFSNQQGNASKLLQFLSDTFNSDYGVRPVFIVDDTWTSLDTTCTSEADVIGINDWFGPPSTPNTFVTLDSFTSGTAVAGFINPSYYDSTSPNYHSANEVIPRNGLAGTGANGDTLKLGLTGAYTNSADLTVLEGFNDVREWAGLYRTLSTAHADYPSQYINIVRSFSDLNTNTLRLEAEAADAYGGPTGSAQNPPVYRRSGTLNCRALSGSGWAVTNMGAGSYIDFEGVNFSPGNYMFTMKYAVITASRRMRILVDGVALPNVYLPVTSDMNTFDTISLGSQYMTPGTHTLRVFFIDAGTDMDWLFVKKTDSLISFRCSSNSDYMTAELGGNATVTCNRTAIGSWEKFSADDSSHATLTSGDVIYLQAKDGLVLSPANGGGGALSANVRTATSNEKFTITKVSGSGAIANGDVVTLKSTNGHYLTVGASSPNTVDVTGTAAGSAQMFTVTLATQ